MRDFARLESPEFPHCLAANAASLRRLRRPNLAEVVLEVLFLRLPKFISLDLRELAGLCPVARLFNNFIQYMLLLRSVGRFCDALTELKKH